MLGILGLCKANQGYRHETEDVEPTCITAGCVAEQDVVFETDNKSPHGECCTSGQSYNCDHHWKQRELPVYSVTSGCSGISSYRGRGGNEQHATFFLQTLMSGPRANR
jgi:hypothetical protein